MEDVKLFTRGDLDRCARLTLLNYFGQSLGQAGDTEIAVAMAVRDIAADAPTYYDEETVKGILRYALPDAPEVAITRTLEKALEYLRS